MNLDNKKAEVFFEEEEGIKDRGGEGEEEEEEETKTKNNNAAAKKIRSDPASSGAGPRRFTDDDDSSVGSSSSEASASSDTSEHSQSSSSSCSSTISLPEGCLRGIHDKPGGCDEAELRAREKRCMEIMRLSQQVKKAERARAKAANIKPLTWAEPTFECGPTATAADVNAATNSLLGKRKELPDQDSSSSSSSTIRRNPSSSHLDLMQGHVFYNYNPIRQPSEKRLNGLSSL